jgi:hypothetical protein
VSKDPIGFAGGDSNLFAYVGNRPVDLVDSTGLATQPIVTYEYAGPFLYGSHAALRVDNVGNGEPVIYDPGGSYGGVERGSGSGLEGKLAELDRFGRYQARHADLVVILNFETTPGEEAEIASRFGYDSDQGIEDPGGGMCAISVSNVVSGVGPFRNVPHTWFPGSLLRSAWPTASSFRAYVPGPVSRQMGPFTMVPTQ